MGIKFIELPVNPTGMNPIQEFKTFRFLYKLYRKNPDAIIHHVGLKNMLWGGLATRFTKTRGVLYAVSGLGTLFGETSSKVVGGMIQKFLKFAMQKKNVAVIFQNHDDERLFIDRGIVDKDKAYFTKGSGVDLKEMAYKAPSKENPVVVIFTARMLREKGVVDLMDAADLLKEKYSDKVEFWLCGGLSSNPTALSEEYLKKRCDGKYLKWLGHRTDVPDLLRKASIMCFPSYYREGVPKSLIEASAIGRPIITTDSIGCRDTVVDGENGILVPVHSPEALANALDKLISNPDLRKSMGMESRKIAERDYSINAVTDLHVKIYDKLYTTSIHSQGVNMDYLSESIL
ncbi:MAG: glycosyltransferase family 4 protein [Muribaculaceae bacterium]|nr:glycosyltransferase family 4 protein [Muribaculaceae bacterium]